MKQLLRFELWVFVLILAAYGFTGMFFKKFKFTYKLGKLIVIDACDCLENLKEHRRKVDELA